MPATKDELLRKYWELLHDAADYIECGYSRPRRVPRPLPRESSRLEITEKKAAPEEGLARIAEEVAVCSKCGLHTGRTHTVPGMGAVEPLVMCIGEAPGAEEDRTGRPFVGKAGQYLDKWLDAIGLSREENVFIGNIIKCRPPNNRDPHPEEMEACLPYLKRQIEIIRPKTILTLGRISSQVLSGQSKGIGALRGTSFLFMDIPCIPTYHPSGVLRNPEYRKPVWEDLQRLQEFFSHA